MYCLLPTRYERTQSSTAPPNPNDTSSQPRRVLWSTQSKAALRSSIPSRVNLPMSAVWGYLQEGGICGMAASICRLMFRKETVRMEMKKHPLVDGPFEYFWYERQIRDGPVAAEHWRIEGRLQSCPRATFLGPDPTRQNVDPTRPAIADPKSDPTRPDPTRPVARSFPHMYSLYLNNNLLIS